MPVPQSAVKTKTIAVNPHLHQLLKLLATLDKVGMNELTEPVLWEVVRGNQDRLERASGEKIEIPDPKQLNLVALEG